VLSTSLNPPAPHCHGDTSVVFRAEAAIGVHWANPLSLLELSHDTPVPNACQFPDQMSVKAKRLSEVGLGPPAPP